MAKEAVWQSTDRVMISFTLRELAKLCNVCENQTIRCVLEFVLYELGPPTRPTRKNKVRIDEVLLSFSSCA